MRPVLEARCAAHHILTWRAPSERRICPLPRKISIGILITMALSVGLVLGLSLSAPVGHGANTDPGAVGAEAHHSVDAPPEIPDPCEVPPPRPHYCLEAPDDPNRGEHTLTDDKTRTGEDLVRRHVDSQAGWMVLSAGKVAVHVASGNKPASKAPPTPPTLISTPQKPTPPRPPIKVR